MSVAGGGPIVDIGVHCIDTLRYILQDEVVKVSAQRYVQSAFRADGAGLALLLEFSRGTLATVNVSFRAAYRSPLEIVGTDGALFAMDALNVERPITLQLIREREVVDLEVVSNTSAYAIMLDSFADSLEGNGTFRRAG